VSIKGIHHGVRQVDILREKRFPIGNVNNASIGTFNNNYAEDVSPILSHVNMKRNLMGEPITRMDQVKQN